MSTVKMMDIDDLPPEIRSILEGLFGDRMKFIAGEGRQERDAFDDPMVERLMKIAEVSPLRGSVPALESFGFNMHADNEEMRTYMRVIGGAAATEWMDAIMPQIIERKGGSPHVDLENLAACAYMMGLAHGIAFDKGCDGVSCEHCAHHNKSD